MKVTRCILPSVKNDEESNCAMFDEAGKKVSFNVKHGILEISKDDPDHDYLLRTVTANGFIMLDVVDVDDPKKKKGKNGGKAKYSPPIRLEHPDQSPSHDINTTVEISSSESAGKPAKVELEHGIAEVELPWVVTALVDRGYRVMNPHELERQTTQP
jgi:hypothetical protein